jgi:tetratricopeptide (TPR) repeat protein
MRCSRSRHPEVRTSDNRTSTPPGGLDETLPVTQTESAVSGVRIANRYRLIQPLGRGGYGMVWEAEDTLTGEIVAVKLLGDRPGKEAARVRREIAALRLLRLPGVVQLLDEGLSGGRSFFVMERISGHPFPGLLPSGRAPHPWSEVAGTVIALLETLARVHAAGIVHRDLKPGNVLVREDGRPVVLDFGISRLAVTAVADDDSISGDEEVIGTPAYIAPEQIRGCPATPRTDLYTFGIMLYEVLGGRSPQDTNNVQMLLTKRLSEPAIPLSAIAPEVPPVVARVVDRMLARRPEERPRSAIEVLSVLQGEPGSEPSRIGPGRLLEILAVASAGEAAALLAPLDEPSLRALFAGPDRLLHLREDAARALWIRTEGLPGRVAEEVNAWMRAGLAWWDGDRLVVGRDAIDRLETGLHVVAPPAPATSVSLPAPLEELLRWIEIASPHPDPWLLAAVTERPASEIEAAIEDLVRRGAIRRAPGGLLEIRALSRLDEAWSEEQRSGAHRAIAAALQAGAPGRLVHLLSGNDETGEQEEIAIEAGALAERLAREGQLGKAVVALGEGVRAARWATPAASRTHEALLGLWIQIAIAEGTPTALDRVLYEVHRAPVRTLHVEHLEQLARAALATFNSRGEPALALADAVPSFDDPNLERQRHAVRVRASQFCPIEHQEAVIVDAEGWVNAHGSTDARSALASWTARLRYRQGRFDEAAALYAQAAQDAPWLTEQILETLSAASSLMEAFRHGEAERWAESARNLAMACRLPYLEARAEWILRTTAYRIGRPMLPDKNLVEALESVGVPALKALACLTEAAVAFRAGILDDAASLAEGARRTWARMGREDGVIMCRSIAVASGASTSAEEVQELAQRALSCTVVGAGIQILALLARTEPTLTVRRTDVERLIKDVPRDHWEVRMDVLSITESLAAVRIAEE